MTRDVVSHSRIQKGRKEYRPGSQSRRNEEEPIDGGRHVRTDTSSYETGV